MLSRVADCVYWMFRYVERAENVARFLDVNYNLSLGAGDAIREQWAPLVYTTGDQALFEQRYDSPTRENVVQFLAFDNGNPNSILSCVQAARENARTIREVISTAMWEEVNKFYHMVRTAAVDYARESPFDFCSRVKLANHLLIGVTDSTMSHGEAWHFGRMGRMIERADKTSRLIDVQYYLLLPDHHDVGSSLDVVRWSALLKSASALAMYRREHGKIVPTKVGDFLILNRQFPRSIHFCVEKALSSLRQITGSPNGTFRNRAEKSLGRLESELNYLTIQDVIDRGLHETIDDFQLRLNDVGNLICDDFFTAKHCEPQFQLQEMRQ